MQSAIICGSSRGHLNLGWLDTYHTFSFGEYHDRTRMNFGALRVLNDDFIAPQGTFLLHPHNNMEIISVILKGSIAHQDNLGNQTIISAGEIQVMSAGTGIMHSEANPSASEELNLLQIWIYPRKQNIQPHYAQKNFQRRLQQVEQWHTLVAPVAEHADLLINQEAYIALGEFKHSNTQPQSYRCHYPEHGIFLMVLEGRIKVGNDILERRDAMQISQCPELEFNLIEPSKLIAIEVPLNFKPG